MSSLEEPPPPAPGEEEDGLPKLENLGLTDEAWDYLVAAKWAMSVAELRALPPAEKAEYRVMYRVINKIEARHRRDAAELAVAAYAGGG